MPLFPEAVREQLSSAALKPIGWSLNAMARIAPQRAGALALKLFTRPRSHKSSTHHPEVLSTAERTVFRFSETKQPIHIFRWPGKGPRVFLAHGWESNTSRWLALVRSLRRADFEIIGVDAPAHGYSEGREFNVPLYARVLRETFGHFAPDIFIGHSAGAMAGLYHLDRHEATPLQAMVLMAVPHELEDLMDTFRQIVGMNDRVFAGLKMAFEQRFGSPMSVFSMPQFASRLQLPGLIVHDLSDTIAPYHVGVAIHKSWQGSRLFTTENLGHSLPGVQVVEAVMNFLDNAIIF